MTDAVLARLPKVALHDHLDGGLRPRTVLELGSEAGVRLPSADVDGLRAWIAERAAAGSLEEYLRCDELTVIVTQRPDALTRIAREAVEDLAADGVVYAELRWAPEACRAGGATLDEVIAAVRRGLAEGMESTAAVGRPVIARQLLCAMRNGPHSREVAEATVRHHDPARPGGVVGFDIAGPESGFPPSLHRDAFDHLARHSVPVTVHAGESEGPASIASALADGRALRLGHGIRIAEDVERDEHGDEVLGELAVRVRDEGIVLETSPTSNVHTGAVRPWGAAIEQHPFDRLRRAGFAVTVNTDNRLTSATSLTRELAELVRVFGYGLDDLERFQRTAARAAFLPPAERVRVEQVVTSGFAVARTA
ncbi:adenosine deaminase [Pseudonocardia spinosispora]|uniref:adenosine deaminase n=1 Tax=Pseudonocardia spinosispora TaxID=103441 RepID=UPI001FE15600|nr:adenosine deaminase [Pseudonocardia spinosispora]